MDADRVPSDGEIAIEWSPDASSYDRLVETTVLSRSRESAIRSWPGARDVGYAGLGGMTRPDYPGSFVRRCWVAYDVARPMAEVRRAAVRAGCATARAVTG